MEEQEHLNEFKALATKIYEAFTSAYPNSHASINRDQEVTYPYITYDLNTNPNFSMNQEQLIINVQIFDSGKSYSGCYGVASKLKKKFKRLKIWDDHFHLRFDVQRGASTFMEIPTGDPNIVRLEGTIQAKIDWREEDGITNS